ncbi:MAG: hypothetical protein P1P83_09745 [Bacteroidales bacterium]|nr:hypothetical protein [Bacteroidales bacterium]
MTYHVIPIGLTVLAFYLYTLYLSSTGFTARQSHRRIWNWVLLVAFTMTGLFGLFMALKITYRWDIPFYDQLLNWHVEAGISMTFMVVIHLVRNLRYYFSRGSEAVFEGDSPDLIPMKRSSMLLLLTGFVSSSSQFIMMREAVILGGGTEVSAALFLWIWLIIAAAGAIAGNRSRITEVRRMIWTLLAATALAPVAFILMNILLLNRGETATLLQIAGILAVSIAPVTFIASLVFIRLSVIRKASSGLAPGGSFGVETAGSVAAGVLTAMTVTLHVPNYELYLLILLLAAVVSVTLLGYTVRAARISMLSLIPLAILIMIANPDLPARSLLLRGVTTVKSTDTPFGNITTAIYGGEQTVFYDHRPLFFSSDVVSREENIHYALLQRENYEKVMLISGGLRQHLPELEKYNIKELIYLEHDPGVIIAEGARDTVAGGMKVTVVGHDPITELRDDEEVYDAVVQLIPPPSTLSVNRFYTVEYFRLVKEHLSEEGIFLCTPMPYYNYSPESYRKSFSPLYNALNEVFTHIAVIPGSALYTVASDYPVTTAISRLSGSRSLENSYVNSDYLEDGEIRMRSEQIILQVDREAGMNSALRPVSSLFANILSLERMGNSGEMILLLAISILIPFLFTRRGGLMMFASSAALAGFGMIMIFILQIAVGNIYILSAIILTLLMAGLAAGAAQGNRLSLTRLSVCTLILAALYLAAGFLSPSLVTATPRTVTAVIVLFLPVAGFVTGAVYRILTTSGAGGATGSVYASDLAGAALGYLTVATIVVPLAGTAGSCFVLAALILVSGIVASVVIKH